jgi:predicted TIM-barrel fold metal-dependent hydrolase
MIVDAHAYIGFSHRRYPLRVRSTQGLLDVMDRFGIEKACVSSIKAMQYDFIEGNQELKRETEKHPDRFIPFCVVHPRYWADVKDEMVKCVVEWRFAGVVLHPLEQGFPADCLSVKRLMEVVEHLGVPVAIHSAEDDVSHPRRIGALAAAFPSIRFIMYHMGRIFAFHDAIEVAMEHRNIILDTTDVTHHDGVVEKAVRMVGADRVVWGSNLPISYPGPNLKRILIARVTEEERQKILGGNILSILGRSPGEGVAPPVPAGMRKL